MSRLQYRQSKIQAKRKQTPWRDFVREICSWYPIHLYNHHWIISIYPQSWRKSNIYDGWVNTKVDWELCSRYEENSFTQSFIQSFQDLFYYTWVPWLHHYYGIENTVYANHVSNTKNAYLSFHTTGWCENVLYSLASKIHVKNIYNSTMSWIHSENVFQSLAVIHSYSIFYSRCIKNCNNIWFCNDMVWCTECINCQRLENQSYCIENIPYPREEYIKKKIIYLKKKTLFVHYYETMQTKAENIASKNVSWVYCTDSEDVENWRYSHFVHQSRNIFFGGHPDGLSYAYDALFTSAWSNYYGACGVWWDSQNIYNCVSIMKWFDCYYSYYLESCSFCLWCIGLKNKSYCILNKQYTKEEWYEKVDEIFSQMESDWILWDFFPPSMNPFYFNDTAAYLIDPTFTKEEVTKLWYLRRDELIRVDIPADAQIVKTDELDQYEWYDADWNRTIDKSILDKVIQDPQGNVYKIVKMELDFLIKHGLPLPRKHRLDRMKENFRIN